MIVENGKSIGRPFDLLVAPSAVQRYLGVLSVVLPCMPLIPARLRAKPLPAWAALAWLPNGLAVWALLRRWLSSGIVALLRTKPLTFFFVFGYLEISAAICAVRRKANSQYMPLDIPSFPSAFAYRWNGYYLSTPTGAEQDSSSSPVFGCLYSFGMSLFDGTVAPSNCIRWYFDTTPADTYCGFRFTIRTNLEYFRLVRAVKHPTTGDAFPLFAHCIFPSRYIAVMV